MTSIKEAPQPTADSEATRQPSIIERYRRGEVSKTAVLEETVPLTQYIKNNKLPIMRGYATVYQQLGESNPAVVRIKKANKPRAYTYRIDQSLADAHVLPKLRELYPGRSEEERASAQAQLLRVGVSGYHRGKRYSSITIDEAVTRLQSRSRGILWRDRNIADEVISLAIYAVIPYLTGERGNFSDFDKFVNFFNRVLKRKSIDLYRKRKKEVSLDEQGARGIVYSSEDSGSRSEADRNSGVQMVESLLTLMSEKDAIVVRLRFLDEMKYRDIAVIDGRKEGALRRLIYRTRDRLNPTRKRKKHITRKIPDNQLVDD